MDKIITYENLRHFAYSNDELICGEINGFALDFIGLGNTTIYNNHTSDGVYYAEKGVIYLHPYCNPWSWMNDDAVNLTDELIDVLISHYGLPINTPVISTGGSMGGQSALVFTAKTKHNVVACITNCPVCDLVAHYSERADLPRTLYSAFYHVEGSVEEALSSASPLRLASTMPKIPYVVYHCTADNAVNIDLHSRKFKEVMTKEGHDITLIEVDGCSHCDLPSYLRTDFHTKVIDFLLYYRTGKFNRKGLFGLFKKKN